MTIRYMRCIGIFGTFNGVHDGANSLIFGYRMRFCERMVGARGIEPRTSCVSSRRSYH